MSSLESLLGEEESIIERSPQGRYVRFAARLGSGAYKTVYRAYDTDQGIDVAWNAIDIAALPVGEKARIIQEVQLLQKLEHKNIINFYGSWFSKEKSQVVFITEIMTSGTLKSYILRVQFVKLKIIKRWCRQILEGLQYLHSQTPPIIHRDLKCENIFINGNTGDLRIGDLGLSTQMAVEQRAQSVLGTPEFMAPELYDENYDEKVDIYAFGMCVLEMVTKEVPYSECTNPAQIYKKVIAGIRPRGLQRVSLACLREFIELCLSRVDGNIPVTASYLLNHNFLCSTENDDVDKLVYPLTRSTSRSTIDRKGSVDDFILDDFHYETRASDNRRMSVPAMPIGLEFSSFTSEAKVEPSAQYEIPDDPGQRDTLPSVGEPMSGESTDDHIADQILAKMPDDEAGIQDERMNVMAGRGHRLDLPSSSSISEVSNTVGVSNATTVSASSAMQIPTVQTPNIIKGPSTEIGDTNSPKDTIPDIKKRTEEATSTGSDGSKWEFATLDGDGALRKRGNRHDIMAVPDLDNEHSILLKLRIMVNGKSKEIKFSFNLFTDSPYEVACELAADVGISEIEVEDIANSISFLVTEGKNKNLLTMTFDVWDEGPEPHAFPFKPLPVGTNPTPGVPDDGTSLVTPVAANLQTSVVSAAPAPPTTSASLTPPLVAPHPSSAPASYRLLDTSENSFDRTDIAAPVSNLGKSVPTQGQVLASSSKHPTLPGRVLGLPPVPNSPPENDFSIRNRDRLITEVDEDPELQRKRKDLEDRLKIAESAFDQRDSSLEAAIRDEEEKHRRELERYRKKMAEYELKKQKAHIARQQRLQQVALEFQAEVQAERKKWVHRVGNGPPMDSSSYISTDQSGNSGNSGMIPGVPTMMRGPQLDAGMVHVQSGQIGGVQSVPKLPRSLSIPPGPGSTSIPMPIASSVGSVSGYVPPATSSQALHHRMSATSANGIPPRNMS